MIKLKLEEQNGSFSLKLIMRVAPSDEIDFLLNSEQVFKRTGIECFKASTILCIF